jgi:hypothetical protein
LNDAKRPRSASGVTSRGTVVRNRRDHVGATRDCEHHHREPEAFAGQTERNQRDLTADLRDELAAPQQPELA